MDAPVTRIRLLLGEMPTLLRNILHDGIAGAEDLELVADVAAPDALAAAIRWHVPDVVVVASGSALDSYRPAALLRAAPHARVLSIEAGGQQALMYEVRPHHTPLDDVSMKTLLEAIRAERAFTIDAPLPG
jgi:DNA-binding NarL/FixJ family response regulator